MTLVHPTTTTPEAPALPGADPQIPKPPSPRSAPAGRVLRFCRAQGGPLWGAW